MNKPTSEKAIPLPVLCYGRGIEDQVVDDFLIIEAANRDKNCYYDNNERD
jgi:hypothetical protein